MGKLHYAYNCTSPDDIDELYAIVDDFSDITYETFRRNVDTDDFDTVCLELGYFIGNEKGLHIKDDWSVSFHKSKYNGKTIYFFCQSAIEYVFK